MEGKPDPRLVSTSASTTPRGPTRPWSTGPQRRYTHLKGKRTWYTHREPLYLRRVLRQRPLPLWPGWVADAWMSCGNVGEIRIGIGPAAMLGPSESRPTDWSPKRSVGRTAVLNSTTLGSTKDSGVGVGGVCADPLQRPSTRIHNPRALATRSDLALPPRSRVLIGLM